MRNTRPFLQNPKLYASNNIEGWGAGGVRPVFAEVTAGLYFAHTGLRQIRCATCMFGNSVRSGISVFASCDGELRRTDTQDIPRVRVEVVAVEVVVVVGVVVQSPR